MNQTLQTFKDIWARRSNLPKYWKGDKPKAAFNYQALLEDTTLPHLINFENSNWNDVALYDLRQFLYTHITFGENQFPNVTIYHNVLNNQNTYLIFDGIHDETYLISIYKNRGRINAFLNTEYGKPISLLELTNLLIALDLEQPYQQDDDENDYPLL